MEGKAIGVDLTNNCSLTCLHLSVDGTAGQIEKGTKPGKTISVAGE